YEPLDHLAPEELRVVERVERDPEVRGRAAGVLPRLVGATAARRGVRGARGREAHPHAHDVLAALREERGGERRVDPAAHRDEDAVAHVEARTRASINAARSAPMAIRAHGSFRGGSPPSAFRMSAGSSCAASSTGSPPASSVSTDAA